MATSPTGAVPVDELESLLTCSICIETLNEPRTLPCFHSFCKVCLEKFVKRHREEASGVKEIEVFNCPTCRSEFNLKPKDEVAGMASSHFIRNMLDVMAIQRPAKVSQCARCQEPAVCRCTTCDMFMCEKCLASHESWPSNKKHTVLSINELSQLENQAKIRAKLHCKKHENKTLKFYCETCQELVCRYCMDFQHVRPDHLCLPLVEVAEKQREVLASRCTILEESLKEGNDALELISNAKHSLEDNAKKAKKDITRQKEEVLKIFTQKLEEKATLMINEVEKKFKETHKPLVEQETEVKRHVDKIKGSFNLAKNLLEKGNDEEILSSQKMIAENIERMKQEQPWSMKPVHDGNIEYQSTPVNDNDVTMFLNKLGKVACCPAAVPCELCNSSFILGGHVEYGKQMKKWLGVQFQWRLCYRASRDGWRAQDFHRCCDKIKGPTVTLVKVVDYVFGGYTDQSWAGVWKRTNSSFLFSLKNKYNMPAFRCRIRENQWAIYSHGEFGPTFGGGHDLYISDNSNLNQESYSEPGTSYHPPPGCQPFTTQTCTVLAGSYYFTPTEIEVFY